MSRPSASVVFVLAVGLALAPRFAAAGAPPAALATTAPTTLITPVTSDPALPPARHLELRLRADSLWAARARKEATPLYRQVVDDCPADGESRFRLAAGLAALGRRAEAADELKRCLADGFVDIAPSAYQLAAAAAEAGRTDEALDWLDRALAARYADRAGLRASDSFSKLRDNPRFRAQAAFPPAGLSDRVAGWSWDLDFFRAEARRLHAAPERPAAAPEFDRAVDALKARLATLDDLAVALELQKLIVAQLGDGHSVVYPLSTPRVDFGGALPVRFYLFSDGLHVIEADAAHASLVGRRVTAIGGRPVAELLAAVAPYVARDNDQGLAWLAPLYLRFPGILRALGAANAVTAATLSLAPAEAGAPEESVPLGSVPPDARPQRLVPPPGGAPAAWLARLDTPYWHAERADLDGWYAQVNAVRNADTGPSLAEWVEGLRREMAAHPRRNLVLDLRHNNGGNNGLIWPLVRLAAWHEMADPTHRTWVITGRGTFSAAQDLVNFLDRATNANFIGEPAASRPNFTGEDTPVQLPWSGLQLSIASRYWQDAPPTDRRRYVPVAMPVALSAADWRANRDPVLEALGEYLRGR